VLIALITLAILALAGMGGLIAVAINQGRVLHKMGNKLIANSDHQLQRIAIEEGADAYREATRRAQGYAGSISHIPADEEIPPEVSGEVRVPARGG
jgi:glutamate dehydrogenase/leucine dehydrogenase